MKMHVSGWVIAVLAVGIAGAQTKPMASAQSSSSTPGGQGAQPPVAGLLPTKDDLLRGGYGPYRANNDLLSYHLTLRVDPVAKTIGRGERGAVSDAEGRSKDPVGTGAGSDGGWDHVCGQDAQV